MKNIKIYISNPESKILHKGNEIWIISAANPDKISKKILDTKNIDFETISNIVEEATIIKLIMDKEKESVNYISLYKSITSKYELFYLLNSNGDLVVTDHFKNAINELEVEDRKVSSDVVIDHLIFTTLYGNETHISNIKRLGNGEVLNYNLVQNKYEIKIIEKLYSNSDNEIDYKNDMKKIDETLGKIAQETLIKDKTANMLSGGIDSTLIHTYLGSDFPSLSIGIDSPEFEFEMEYARSASALLKTDHQMIMLKEEDYLQYIEQAIDILGMPVGVFQLPMYISLSKVKFKRFITGYFMDCLFGLPTIKKIVDIIYLNKKIDQNNRAILSNQIDKDYYNPLGCALQNFTLTPNLKYGQKMFGEEYINSRLLERLEYVTNRVKLNTCNKDKLTIHCEVGSMIDFLCEDVVSLWRQIQYSFGKSIYCPANYKSLVNVSLSFPVSYRYLDDNNTIKHLLKALLKKRLPEYPVNIPKGGSGLPRTRYCTEGPLKNIFEKYPVPDFINKEYRKVVTNPAWETSWLTFSVATYSIWEQRVLKNPDLSIVPGTKVICKRINYVD